MGFQFNLDHEFRQREAFHFQPGARRKFLLVDRITKACSLQEPGHVCRKDILDNHVVEGIAVMVQDFVQVAVTVLHLLRQVTDRGRITRIVHAHSAGDQQVVAETHCVSITVRFFDFGPQLKILGCIGLSELLLPIASECKKRREANE